MCQDLANKFRPKHIIILLGVCCFFCLPAEHSLGGPPDKLKLETLIYDLGDLIHRPGSAKPGWTKIDTLAKMLVVAIDPESWNNSGKDGNRLHIINGTKLAIRTTKKTHDQIKDYLRAFRNLTDCAVEIRCNLLRFERHKYDKRLKPKLAKNVAALKSHLPFCPSDQALDELFKIIENSVADNTVRIADRRTAHCIASRRVIPYVSGLDYQKVPAAKAYDVAIPGITVFTKVEVSPDRRKILLTITQKLKALVALEEKKTTNVRTLKLHPIKNPKFVDSTRAGSIEVFDGQIVLVLIPNSVLMGDSKKFVHMLIMRPDVWIEAEQKLIQQELHKKKSKQDNKTNKNSKKEIK